jgi:hypothetical protein
MNYIKLFETFENTPQINDYAIVDLRQPTISDDLDIFTQNNISQIKQIKKQDFSPLGNHNAYQIEYEKIPEKYTFLFQQYVNNKDISYSTPSINYYTNIKYRRWIKKDNIIFFSHNINDCELFIQAKKYNL